MTAPPAKTGRSLRDQLASFSSLWRGGYYEGDPLDPMGRSGYGSLGYMSVLHATYLTCIKPYVSADTVALEIGPGRGAWTKCLLAAREVWCLDALSAEHNGFWDYVGEPRKVRYFQVSDFECSELPDAHFDYFFTFGTFCHVSIEGITAYMANLRTKLVPGAHCFLMVADFAKFNRSLANAPDLAADRMPAQGRGGRVLRRLVARERATPKDERNDGTYPDDGMWYNAGTERTCNVLTRLGYQVVDADVGVNHRDPIIHCIR